MKNKNKSHRAPQEGAECDPNTDLIRLDAGIVIDRATGLIQCGAAGLICIQEAASAMGGACDPLIGGDPGDNTQDGAEAECDPAAADAIDLDAGVLQCGTNVICIQHGASITTGVCASNGGGLDDGFDDGLGDAFNFVVFAAPCSDEFEIGHCGRSDFDLSAGTGAIACELSLSIDDCSLTREFSS